jgi:hypothetical protein
MVAFHVVASCAGGRNNRLNDVGKPLRNGRRPEDCRRRPSSRAEPDTKLHGPCFVGGLMSSSSALSSWNVAGGSSVRLITSDYVCTYSSFIVVVVAQLFSARLPGIRSVAIAIGTGTLCGGSLCRVVLRLAVRGGRRRKTISFRRLLRDAKSTANSRRTNSWYQTWKEKERAKRAKDCRRRAGHSHGPVPRHWSCPKKFLDRMAKPLSLFIS